MKIEIEICSDKEEGKDKGMHAGKSMELSAFQMKVAKMLAKKNGRAKPNEMDFEKVKELEEEED